MFRSTSARTGLDARLVHLSVTGLDAKTLAVHLANRSRVEPDFPHDVKQFLGAALVRLLVRVAFARHTDGHTSGALLAAYLARERVPIVTILFLANCSQAGGLLSALRFAATGHGRNDKAQLRTLQISDHLDTEKPLV